MFLIIIIIIYVCSAISFLLFKFLIDLVNVEDGDELTDREIFILTFCPTVNSVASIYLLLELIIFCLLRLTVLFIKFIKLIKIW